MSPDNDVCRRLPKDARLCPKCLGSCVQSAPPGIPPGQPFATSEIGPWVCTMCYGTGYVVEAST